MIEGENCPAYDSMKFLEGAQLVKERFLDFFQGSDKSRVCLLDEKLDTDLCLRIAIALIFLFEEYWVMWMKWMLIARKSYAWRGTPGGNLGRNK